MKPSPGSAVLVTSAVGFMYLECKASGLVGPARIGRVSFSKTGATLYYRGKELRSLKGHGSKANYYEVETSEPYWISGCRKGGADRLYGERLPIEIDDDVREEYWTAIREQPENRGKREAWRLAGVSADR